MKKEKTTPQKLPNTKYIRGRQNEYKAMKILKCAGFNCLRSAGSHGMFDIVAYNRDRIRFIQVKSNDHITKEERKELVDFTDLPVDNCTKELWTFYDGKSVPKVEIWDLEIV